MSETEAESTETRIEKLEISKEDTEKELDFIDKTIQQVDFIDIELPKSTTASEELHIFKQRLDKQKEANEQILQEIKESIELVRGY